MTEPRHPRMPDAANHWTYGDVVALRFIRNRPADSIVPVRVVADDPSHVALYLQPGSPRLIHATADGGALPRSIPFLERERLIGGLRDYVWTDRHVLMLQEPGRMSSIWYWWSEESWEFIGAYGGEASQPASLDELLRRLERGDFDLVAVGRALLQDPEWAVKVHQGRTSELKNFERSAMATLY